MANDSKDQNFPGPSLKIIRAKRHHEELIKILEAYGSRLETKWIEVEGDPNKVQLNFSEASPPEIPLVIGDVVHNLRSALDLLVNDIAQKRGFNIDTARLQFPYATNEINYKKIVFQDFSKVGQDLHDTLLDLRVYEGGNDLLCGLHNLDIRDKHRYVMPLLACAWGRPMSEYLRKDLADIIGSITFLSFDDKPSIAEEPSLDVEGTICLKSQLRPESFEPYRSKHIPTAIFPKGMPFEGKHVVKTLTELINVTESVIESFKNKFS